PAVRAHPSGQGLAGERETDAVAAEEVGVLARCGEFAREEHAEPAYFAGPGGIRERVERPCSVLVGELNLGRLGAHADPYRRVAFTPVAVAHRVDEELLQHDVEPQAALPRHPGLGAERLAERADAAHIERGSERLAARVGMPVQEADRVVTGADGTVGITFADNSLLSIGPGSSFAIDRYVFDSTTHAGKFDSTLSKGTLAVVSGKMV